jgi:hypothetical protein
MDLANLISLSVKLIIIMKIPLDIGDGLMDEEAKRKILLIFIILSSLEVKHKTRRCNS